MVVEGGLVMLVELHEANLRLLVHDHLGVVLHDLEHSLGEQRLGLLLFVHMAEDLGLVVVVIDVVGLPEHQESSQAGHSLLEHVQTTTLAEAFIALDLQRIPGSGQQLLSVCFLCKVGHQLSTEVGAIQ